MRSRIIVAALFVLIALAATATSAWWLQRPDPLTEAPPGWTQTRTALGVEATLAIDQPEVGDRQLRLTVRDERGAPVPVTHARLRMGQSGGAIGMVEVELDEVAPGEFVARGPFFPLAGTWLIVANLTPPAAPQVTIGNFEVAIAAAGEISGPLNPFRGDLGTIRAGEQIYVANCASCHGTGGRGDGPAGGALDPPPADLTYHMRPGKHTDGQIFLWVRDGYPLNATMPAWGDTLSETEIWQLITYLRTIPDQLPVAAEPLPPLLFARAGVLWRSDGTGTEPAQITLDLPPGSRIEGHALSPDGQQIALINLVLPPDGGALRVPTLYLANVDGSGLRPLWEAPGYILRAPAWSPDGSAVYLAAEEVAGSSGGVVQPAQVMRIDSADAARSVVVENGADPAPAPNGSQLAFVRNDLVRGPALLIQPLDGSAERTLVANMGFDYIEYPRFSPDGDAILFAASGGPRRVPESSQRLRDRLLGWLAAPVAEAHGQPWEIWVVNADGSELRQLTTIGEEDPVAAFAPDGSQLAVIGTEGIYILDSDGGNFRKIDTTGGGGGLDWLR